ncbi:MAG: hypothetical protein H3C36_09460 [Chitinophagaceae bacterium]|nr:hypothetical protein [Chitinophagaceae bacterium]MCZ2395030.1 hypothetical protein [Chitinophagales bacterium]
MNTKLLMASSAIFMGLMGIALSFMPNEILKIINQAPNTTMALILQLAGALYFGMAMTNWFAKTVLIGGIYSKPLSIGNFAHFFIAGLALIKYSLNSNKPTSYIITLTILYSVFAVLFGYVSFTNPSKKQDNH